MRSLWKKAERHVTVAREPNAERGWWLGFPDVVSTGPTSLVAVHNDGAGHGGGGAMLSRRSSDLGRTWSAPVSIHPQGINCPRIQALRDGSLLALGDLHAPRYPVVLYTSTDDGRSWSPAGTLDPAAAGGHGTCVPSRVTEAGDDSSGDDSSGDGSSGDGSWILHGTYTPGEAWKVTAGETIEFYRSEDRGKSWKLWSSLAPPRPLSICESSIVTLADGRWLLVARESGGFLPGVRSWSSDGGRSWSPLEELPFFIQGRTCAGLLADGRLMVTFRAGTGPAALWAWVAPVDEKTAAVVRGVHSSDRFSVGLKDGELHIDGDGACGQFTKYIFRPPDSPESRVEVTTVVKVIANSGRAATISVPFVGKLRLYPDRVEFASAGAGPAGDPSLRLEVAPGEFHAYNIVSAGGRATLSIDGRERLVTEKTDRRTCPLPWSALKLSPFLLSFGNEEGEAPGGETSEGAPASAPRVVLPSDISTAVTGYSVWRSFAVRYDDPETGTRNASWRAEDGFPDQYALDHMVEVDATISGCDQGYSGWARLPDGRIFVLNYTDDGARWNCDAGDPTLGVSWIRGTHVLPEDLPPR
jgi:hypothetical protein